MVPEISVTEEDARQSAFSEAKLQQAADLYNENGCLLIHNVFNKEFIQGLKDSYIKKYEKYFVDRIHSDALRVGDKRFMITVKLATPFNTPKLYANPFIYELIKGLLGESCIIQALGSVTSLPRAEEQHWHHDHPPLYHDNNIDPYLPSHAITVIIPLVELNEQTGTTAIMLKSHRFPRGAVPKSGAEIIYPTVPVGSCLLFDYNVKHSGQANTSENVRPILYNSYSRPWFRDQSNFRKQNSLVVSKKELKKVPEENLHLFKFASVE
jgi:ectoine hydroxylase-related dioxygenase (phytanoyl-CoA dioxygenase family)